MAPRNSLNVDATLYQGRSLTNYNVSNQLGDSLHLTPQQCGCVGQADTPCGGATCVQLSSGNVPCGRGDVLNTFSS